MLLKEATLHCKQARSAQPQTDIGPVACIPKCCSSSPQPHRTPFLVPQFLPTHAGTDSSTKCGARMVSQIHPITGACSQPSHTRVHPAQFPPLQRQCSLLECRNEKSSRERCGNSHHECRLAALGCDQCAELDWSGFRTTSDVRVRMHQLKRRHPVERSKAEVDGKDEVRTKVWKSEHLRLGSCIRFQLRSCTGRSWTPVVRDESTCARRSSMFAAVHNCDRLVNGYQFSR